MKSIYHINVLKKDELSEKLSPLNFEIIGYGLYCQTEETGELNDFLSHFKICIITQGSCIITYQNRECRLSEGSVIMIPPYTLYGAKFSGMEKVKFYYIHFDVTTLEGKQELKDLFYMEQLLIVDRAIDPGKYDLFESVRIQMQQREAGFYYSIQILLMRLLLKLYDLNVKQQRYPAIHTTSQAPKSKVVMECIEYINQHVYEKIEVSKLCKVTGVSQSYLHQSFQAVLKISTKEFLCRYRFKRIESELTYTCHTMEEIATKFGFPSVYAFSNAFKRSYGVSPSYYRKNMMISMENSR